MVSDFNKKLGLRIRELRLSKNIKQGEFADMLNMERSNFTRIESGKQRPNDENLYRISAILNVEIKDLFDFEHHKHNKDLIQEINNALKNNPEKIKDFYKIIMALTK